MNIETLGRGFGWFDTGTPQALFEAANFVRIIQEHQGIHISVPEEIAYLNKWIDKESLLESAKAYGKSPYGAHLKNIAEGKYRY